MIHYLFAGAGASATLLLMSLEQRGLLKDKNIVLLDPDMKSKNDKAYCFWSHPEAPLAVRCRHLISHEWNRLRVNRMSPMSLGAERYYHIASINLYKELQRIVDENGLTRVRESVINIETTGESVCVTTDQNTWVANTVFDSRPPKYRPTSTNQEHLLQSFIGLVVETETSTANLGCIDLMDFEVEQQGATQFVYVLPFSHNKMLVELTRFGKLAITEAEAMPVLDRYITEQIGEYKVVDNERGVIPMSNAHLDVVPIPNVIALGGRAGAVKPSTGYAFKNMFLHAENLADSLQSGSKPAEISRPSRYKFYDSLLLKILSQQPELGKHIFQKLFQKNKATDVLSFLDEKTTLSQDIRLFASLPIIPFLQAALSHIASPLKKLIKPLSVLLLTFGLLVLHNHALHVFNTVEPILFALGLIFLGIPHGAVDHLLESGNYHTKPDLNFVVRYLGAAFAYLAFWLLLPQLALAFFVIYSMWHFGQADLQEWQPGVKSPIKIWIWGIAVLTIILLGHVVETNQILSNLGVLTIPFSQSGGRLASIIIISAVMIWAFVERQAAMFISCLMLTMAIQLPLITSFGLYFVGQHSLNGWSHLKKGLHASDILLFKKALPFNAGAFFLFAVLLYWFRNDWAGYAYHQVLTIFFIFVSCISFPHVLAMHRFYQKYQTITTP